MEILQIARGDRFCFKVANVNRECLLDRTIQSMNTLIEANLSCLEQGITLLEAISPNVYARKCPEIFGSSIGGHFRHNIDHYIAFMDGFESSEIDYDSRERRETMEEDPSEASRVMARLSIFLKKISGEDLDQPLRIRMDDGGDSSWSQTTLRRELQFLLSHTIHHYALVVSIATRYGINEFPDGFGVAPSTLHYREAKGA